MRKYILLLAITMGFTLFSNKTLEAQSNAVIKLKSGDYQLDRNISRIQESDLESAKYNGYYYVYLHFSEIPTNGKKQQLLEKGVQLLDYLPQYTFISKVKVGTVLSSLINYKVDGVYLISPEFKMSYDVANENYPDHAINGSQVKLVVQNHKEASVQEMDGYYQSHGAKILSHYSFSQLTTISINVSEVRKMAMSPLVRFMEPIAPDAVPEDIVGQSNHRMNYISNPTTNAIPYNGAGVWIAIGDDGALGPHIDYTGRMDQSSVGASSGNHGDHVSGIMMGAGNVNPDGRGMAWGADIKVYDVWGAVNSTPTSYINPGVIVTSTSYGNGCNAGYTSFAQTADQQVRMMPNLMHVFSAGNSGTSNCSYGAGAGWGNITGGIKAGKNVLAVGNVTEIDFISGSSSRGPASDGRIKPDICANGTQVFSCFPNNQYVSNTGTSMAAPGVSGAYGALVHAYKELNGGVTPTSSLMKGTMLNTADDLGNVGPDFKYGWGRLNARKVVEVFENNTYMLDSIGQGGANTHNIVIPSGVSQVKIMVYWNDYEGSTTTTLALVNNIDMTVTNPASNVLFPYILDSSPNATSLNTPATNGVDNLNNMEQVVFDNPVAGTYVVNVAGTVIPQGPQKYYVIYEFITSDIIVTYPIGGEGMTPGTTERLRWDAAPGTNSFTAEYSIDNGSTWNVISNGIGQNTRYATLSVPNVVSGECLFRVTRNGISGQSPMPFSIIGTPSNITFPSSCPSSFEVSWDSVPGATSYEVSVLGNKYMDSVITVTSTLASLTGYSAQDIQWVSVKAKTSLAIGKRAIAIEKPTGVWNCAVPNDIGVDLVSPSGSVMFTCVDLSSTAVSLILKNNGTTSVTNVDLSYQYDSNPVNVETFYGVLNPGDSVGFTFVQTINIPIVPTTHNLSVWKNTIDDNPLNDTVHNPFRVYTGAGESLPYAQDFESFNTCSTNNDCGGTNCFLGNGWTNTGNGAGDDIDFRTNSGATPSSGTGPNSDHSQGTSQGKYLYLEASGACEFRQADLYSPCFDLSSTVAPIATMWYHMSGTNMGDLHFDVFANNQWHTDVIPVISGNKGSAWLEAVLDLAAFAGSENVIIKFRGVTGASWESDIAIDDFQIAETGVGIVADSMPCFVDGAVIITNSTITSGSSYVWDFGVDATPATANTVGPHSVTYSSGGAKSVQLSVTVNGIVETDTKIVNMVDMPVSSFTSFFQTGTRNIQFTNTSSDYSTSYWEFGDGGVSTLDNPMHTYAPGVSYMVTLTTTNSCGDHEVTQKVNNFPLGVKGANTFVGALKVYPNPSSGLIKVKIEGAVAGQGELVIYDLNGKVVYQSNLEINSRGAEKNIDLSNLSKGIYILGFNSNELSDKIRLVIQ